VTTQLCRGVHASRMQDCKESHTALTPVSASPFVFPIYADRPRRPPYRNVWSPSAARVLRRWAEHGHHFRHCALIDDIHYDVVLWEWFELLNVYVLKVPLQFGYVLVPDCTMRRMQICEFVRQFFMNLLWRNGIRIPGPILLYIYIGELQCCKLAMPSDNRVWLLVKYQITPPSFVTPEWYTVKRWGPALPRSVVFGASIHMQLNVRAWLTLKSLIRESENRCEWRAKDDELQWMRTHCCHVGRKYEVVWNQLNAYDMDERQS